MSAVQALMREVKRRFDALVDRIVMSDAQIESVKAVVANMKNVQDVMIVSNQSVTDKVQTVSDKVDTITSMNIGVSITSLDSDIVRLKNLLETEIVPEVRHLQGFSDRVDTLQSAINARVEDQMSNSIAVMTAVDKQVKDIIENGNMQIPKLINDMIDVKLVTASNDTVKSVIQRVMAMEAMIANMPNNSTSSGTSSGQSPYTGDKSKKVLLEYVAVNNMKIMGSQGVKFKEWDEKFVNLLGQLKLGSR